MKEYLTIKEFSEVTGLSTQAIYKRLQTDLQPFCKLIDNKKMLNFNALKIFNIFDFQQVDNQEKDELSTSKQSVDNPNIVGILNRTIDLLTKQLQTKDEQLATKDKQIDNLNITINELTLRISELTELQRNNQILMLQEKKPSFLDRIFKRKLNPGEPI